MRLKDFLLAGIILMIIGCKEQIPEEIIEINKNWKFREQGRNNWYQAKVPGTIHTDLMTNKIIDDPFYRINEKKVQWIDKTNWEYYTEFEVNNLNEKKDKTIELVFEGIDTYSEIRLNDHLIIKSDNMFIEWSVICNNYLKEGKNKLSVILFSPININLPKLAGQGYQLPAGNDQSETGELGDKKVSIYARKAPYHFGWDWGPRLVTSGIWKPVYLRIREKAIVKNVSIEMDSTIYSSKAKLKSEIEINSETEGDFSLSISCNGNELKRQGIKINKGMNIIKTVYSLENPELWWPVKMGEQKLYDFNFTLYKGEEKYSQKNITTGLRIAEVVQESDSVGCSFYFKINGISTFMKGANYIPGDVFLNRVTKEKYEKIIDDALESNINMLRVWGGGIYERDYFYELCDKAGIMIWQDFMFACSMYPGDESFLNNLKNEFEYNIKRLRNHPSIVIWCGNNEMLDAWNRWGWKEQFNKEQQNYIWKAYEDIFYNLLPKTIAKLDKSRFYWPSSPSSNYYYPSDKPSGDLHYWGVWHGNEPIEAYNKNVGRFVSEYGFQAFPALKTIYSYTLENERNIYSPVMLSHQRTPIGNLRINDYMKLYYKVPEKFDEFIYVSHLTQAEAMKTAIEAHRRNKPVCMGSLYWQFNDCWPVASWAGIDYYGNWKASQYFIKKSFEDVIIPVIEENGKLNIYLTSERRENLKGEIKVRIIDFLGKAIYKKEIPIEAVYKESILAFSERSDRLKGKLKNNIVLRAEFVYKDKPITSANYYFDKIKDLKLPKLDISHRAYKTNKGYQIEIYSKNLVKNLYIELNVTKGRFSDNYFDMLPGEVKVIDFITKESIDINKKITFYTINNQSLN